MHQHYQNCLLLLRWDRAALEQLLRLQLDEAAARDHHLAALDQARAEARQEGVALLAARAEASQEEDALLHARAEARQEETALLSAQEELAGAEQQSASEAEQLAQANAQYNANVTRVNSEMAILEDRAGSVTHIVNDLREDYFTMQQEWEAAVRQVRILGSLFSLDVPGAGQPARDEIRTRKKLIACQIEC